MKMILFMFLLISTLTFPYHAHAYLDPGSGSYMLQILLGTLVAGFFAIKQYWHRLKYFFKGRFRKKGDQEHE
jgi:uncharacterized membrane protein